ncbi:helix-turn-helix domain-containing protein, partial [Candidatus Bathyarchaeota archaeon]|nr:helix-turn-helix domain-containing protein [Candidatus Bathyarchaeota archaeon]
KILEVGKFQRRREILTEKQERALWLAFKMGFFKYPRNLTMQELSLRLGVSLSTLSETMRRGLRRLLEDHFET